MRVLSLATAECQHPRNIPGHVWNINPITSPHVYRQLLNRPRFIQTRVIDPSASQDILIFGAAAAAALATFASGIERDAEVCERCQGSGGVRCFACQGTGRFENPSLGSEEVEDASKAMTKMVRDSFGRIKDPRACSACGGVGMLMCSTCEGTGYTTKKRIG